MNDYSVELQEISGRYYTLLELYRRALITAIGNLERAINTSIDRDEIDELVLEQMTLENELDTLNSR